MEFCSSVSFKRSKITVSLYANGNRSVETNKQQQKKTSCVRKSRKVMTNLDSVLKSKANTLQTKAHMVKATVFPVVTTFQ